MIVSSTSASIIDSGSFSPQAISNTVTGPLLIDTPNNNISNVSDSAYLYTPHLLKSSSLYVSRSILISLISISLL